MDRLLDQLAAGETFPCRAGSGGGYDDIAAGAPVTVKDGTGTVLATTALTGGTLSKPGCTFAFRTHVPDADFYRVQVSHRDALTFSREELDKQGGGRRPALRARRRAQPSRLADDPGRVAHRHDVRGQVARPRRPRRRRRCSRRS